MSELSPSQQLIEIIGKTADKVKPKDLERALDIIDSEIERNKCNNNQKGTIVLKYIVTRMREIHLRKGVSIE